MNKPTLILISGWACTPPVLSGLAEQLERRFLVITTSTGELWSGSPKDSPYTGGLLELLKSVGTNAIVTGWSMGGMVALETAIRHPGLIRFLVLIGACARFCSAPGNPVGVQPAQLRSMAREMKRNRQQVLSRFFENVAAPELDQELEAKVYSACAMDSAELRSGLDYLQHFDMTTGTARIAGSTLIIHGRADRIIPWQAGLLLNSRLPGSRFVLDDASGHALPIQKPEHVAEEILGFYP